MKQKVQAFGRVLSAMVMPNMGAFIAWGLITALFIPDGWFPNEKLSALGDPMSKNLIPLLIAYTGGSNVHGQRGGVIGAIATMGVIVGSDIPMFLGAMIMGPLSAWLLKKFDNAIEGKVKAGFEMLVNNFSLGILGAILAIISYLGVSPLLVGLNSIMEAGVGFFINNGLLPLANIFIEPAKVLFLNNAINHGILSPMGIEQAREMGKSVIFLLEANPGPGLGILLAYCVAGKGTAKSTAPGAIIIHFFGGIHEIYFPYILMNPILLVAAIAGGVAGTFVFTLFDAGLVAPASPGSILAILAMTPRGGYLGVILGVAAAAVVSYLVALPLLKFFGKDEDLEDAQSKVDGMKAESKGIATEDTTESTKAVIKEDKKVEKINTIVFACDAGMGSSAMGATVLKKKLAAAGLEDIEVVHSSVSSIPENAQIIVTHEDLGERAANSNPKAELITITNFLAAPEYDELVEELKKNQ